MYPACVTFVTFVLYAYLGNAVVPSNVFIVLSFLTLIRFPVSLMPQAITFVSEARVGLQRIQNFLMQEELQSLERAKDAQSARNDAVSPSDRGVAVAWSSPQPLPRGSIVIKNGTFRWSKDNAVPILSGVNLSIEPGELLGIIGTVGSGQCGAPLTPRSSEARCSRRVTHCSLVLLCVVIGKSSLLAAVLGEMEMSGDSAVHVEGKVAFLSQKPWIRNQTVRENILFGLPYDAPRYAQCIAASALLPDFAILPAGDETEIGEQGLNLSGGQKARVSLARALYRDQLTDVYCMDDILSAVDMNVGKIMFDSAVMGRLQHKTRLLVLNSHLHFLSRCHRIAVVERREEAGEGKEAGGVIAAIGSYAEIAARYPQLLSALESEAEEKTEERPPAFNPVTVMRVDSCGLLYRPSEVRPFHAGRSSKYSVSSFAQSVVEGEESTNHHPTASDDLPVDDAKEDHPDDLVTTDALPAPPAPAAAPKVSGALMSIERTGEGEIAASTYLDYFRAASVRLGVLVLVLILFSYVAGQVTRIMSDYWLVLWGTDNNSPPPAHGTEWWVTTWAGWIAGAFFFALSRAWVYTDINIRTSMALHNRVFAKLMRAPVNLFFDITPAGRIVNLMSKDLEQVDTLLPGYLHEFLLYAFQFAGTIILAWSDSHAHAHTVRRRSTARTPLSPLCLPSPVLGVSVVSVVTQYFIAIIVPIVVFFLWIQGFFRATSRELKRLEGTTRSPIFSSFGETLQGLQVIRAYGLSEDFIRENERRVDVNSRVFLTGYLAERWLSIRLEVCSFLVIFAVALLTSNIRGSINPTLAGLTLLYALQMSGLLQWTVRLSIQTENTMTAVERLTAFDELPQEAAYHVNGDVSADWPQRGGIIFTDAKLRYRPELELVMKGINASIRPGEKVGICGRTGSGKSTLMVALFRLVELSAGRIEIDGVDISGVGLERLRSSLSIIPQDAVLFSGSVRDNVDPFRQHSDDVIWQALERVGLAAPVRAMAGGIDAAVAESGDNFSHGQKQLVCIARALLRSTRVLILDEATASIDPASDRALQETLATSFSHCTVLTIAHRLSTIIDYDRIMLLRDGLIAEFDRPSVLLRQRSSLFYAMVSEGGPQLLEQFLRIADKADEAREQKQREAERAPPAAPFSPSPRVQPTRIMEERESQEDASSPIASANERALTMAHTAV